MGVEIIVPSIMFITIGVVLGLFFMFRHRSRAELHHTVRSALERGQELTPELIERLGQPRQSRHADLRKALVWLAVGLAFMIFGVLLDEEDAVRPLVGIGVFPLLIGIAYFIMSRFSEKDAST